MKVTVAEGRQVNHDGVTYGPGEEVDAPPAVADTWVHAGWAEPVQPTKKARPTRR